MKQTLLTFLRDPKTNTQQYRWAAQQLAQILAYESAEFLKKTTADVETSFGHAPGTYLVEQPTLVAVLRSGLVLLPPFLQIYPKAPVGMIGIRRNEKTADPELYSCHLPVLSKKSPLFLLDPMLATGGSASLAIDLLKKAGAEEKNIALIGIIGARKGAEILQQKYPQIRLSMVAVDPCLNAQKMIVPGLGDFGDRFFKT